MADSAETTQKEAAVPEKLGIVVADLTKELAARLRTNETRGVVVMEVKPGSAADDAGISQGDIIKQINATPVNNSSEYAKAVSTLKKGATVPFLVRRGDSSLFVAVKID
jgi:serine protease Do